MAGTVGWGTSFELTRRTNDNDFEKVVVLNVLLILNYLVLESVNLLQIVVVRFFHH